MNIFGQVFGLQGFDGQSRDIKQSFTNTCAIRAQEIILRSFGHYIPENYLVNIAQQYGWYNPESGTFSNDVGKLLELYNIPVNRYNNANIYCLINELAHGKKIIVGVDSGELWGNEELEDYKADHALLVTGIDTTDPNNIKVILTDPGTGDIAKEYPMAQFMDAWHDSNFEVISTAIAPPLEFNPEMINFDYEQGHISTIGELSYSCFQEQVYQSEFSNSELSQEKEFDEVVNENNPSEEFVLFSEDFLESNLNKFESFCDEFMNFLEV